MNASYYINRFWEMDSLNPFSPNETRLYFFLLSRWINQTEQKPFECSTHYLETHLLLPKMTITRCREKLKQRGMIQYVKGDRKVKNPFYFLCGVTNDVTNSVTKHVTNDVTNPKEKVSPTPPLKENNIYNNKEISSYEDIEKAELSPPSKKGKEKSERMDWCAFMQTFNDMLSPAIPKIMAMSESRRQKVKSMIAKYGKESVMTVFDNVMKSDFLRGNNNRGWKADFDWIFNPTNYLKILEGNYSNENRTTQNDFRITGRPGFNNFNEDEARHVGEINSFEF